MKRKFYIDYENDSGAEMRKHPIYGNNKDNSQPIGHITINEKTGSFYIVADKGGFLVEVMNKKTERRSL